MAKVKKTASSTFLKKKKTPYFTNNSVGKKQHSVAMEDARLRIIAKNRGKVVDARDKLALLAKKTDAREKLVKIRNLKQGKLDVRKKGNITITKTVNGSIILSTAKKEGAARAAAASAAASRTAKAKNRRPTEDRKALKVTLKNRTAIGKPRFASTKNIASIILSAKDTLDDELMRTHAKPVILKRTIRQDVRRASPIGNRSPTEYQNIRPPLYTSFRRSESPPSAMEYRPSRSHYDYDDPHVQSSEDSAYRHRLHQPASHVHEGRTLADSYAQSGSSFISPLQGVKIVVSNLQPTVSQEDILELFGDIGALKRAKVASPGTAEVVYVKLADALKAVEVYNNRQLDGKAMKCHIVGLGELTQQAASKSTTPFPRPSSSKRGDLPSPDPEVIYKALFSDKKQPHYSKSQRPSHSNTGERKAY